MRTHVLLGAVGGSPRGGYPQPPELPAGLCGGGDGFGELLRGRELERPRRR